MQLEGGTDMGYTHDRLCVCLFVVLPSPLVEYYNYCAVLQSMQKIQFLTGHFNPDTVMHVYGQFCPYFVR